MGFCESLCLHFTRESGVAVVFSAVTEFQIWYLLLNIVDRNPTG